MHAIKKLHGMAKFKEIDFREMEAKKKMNLEYYLLESDGHYYENENYKMYGIEIIKNELDNQHSAVIESNAIYDISMNKDAVSEILNKLVSNQVTPIGLHPILEDML
jgi:hypothetical protein